ncbi:MAG: sigma-54-dependent Fis family transcriptional regulator [Blastocatellia bacterium]|nr:sigma-54-dependent Fis family transcriptional regulator [Blastocatellia bacterium]
MKRILIIDDDRASCNLLRALFKSQGWEAETAQAPQQALEQASEGNFDLLLIDINLEAEMSGIDLLQQLRGRHPVILMTGYGTLDAAVAAARGGAWDIISKPIKPQELLAMAERAIASQEQKIEEADVDRDMPEEGQAMVGRSPVMLELYKQIARVAPSRSTVLIVGESGTGKELIARSIHEHGEHPKGPFVAVNCGALTETLLEAELFGYLKGSFTGAAADRKGLWEEAEGGTLFLDEIGDTSPAMQVKLLRALQEKEIRRVGSTRNIKVDARVIAATNRDLEKEVKDKTFREDLYYRLSVVVLEAPALRQRRSDIPLLAERFLRAAAENARRGTLRLSEETIKTLVAYDWPGNVRELESAIEYAALQSRGNEITPADLPPKLQSAETLEAAQRSPLAALFDDLPTLDELERRYLLHVLEVVGGGRTNAARVMGIDRRTLYRMAERFKINLADGENESE